MKNVHESRDTGCKSGYYVKKAENRTKLQKLVILTPEENFKLIRLNFENENQTF